ncbi:MAG: xanthine dehydrogenase family protein molybdopterin-binding subunit [Rhizobacter sp.]|nr:xanthine dehydrogenase family protein molybdopterin-binding subunit [Rhizobacter sp.]
MNTVASNHSRRQFLKTTVIATGGLLGSGLIVGCAVMPGSGAKAAMMPSATAPGVMPNAWVKIGADNTVSIICARSEMGQGVFTSLPMLVAEELEVSMDNIRVEMAPAREPYINTMLGGQLTGGSTSVPEAFEPLRAAGAQARMMLIAAAAQEWKVDASACRAENAMVIGPAGQTATYGSLAEAASKLEAPKTPKLKDASAFKIIGKPVKRLDTPAKVDGSAEFGMDVKLPGMLYAALAQCPVIGGKPTGFDATRAKAMPGVKHVVQISDGVAVVADTYWHARKALETVNVKWDEGAGKSLSSASIGAGLKAASAKPGALIKKVGDVDAGMKAAARKIEATYELPFLSHSPMEPMNFTADVRKDSVLLYGPTQFQQLAVGTAAAIAGVKPEQVTIRTTFLGGGFGRRIDVDFIAQVVEISKAVGVPVKLIWSREDDMKHDFYRPIALTEMSAGLDAQGMPTALKFHLTSPSVTSRLFSVFVKDGIDPFMTEASVVPYAIPNQLADVVIHDTGLRVGYWRSVSHALNAFANESFIDELAAAAGKDPLEYRRTLLAKEPRHLNVLNIAAQKSGWGTALPAGRSRGVAVMDGYGTYLALVSEISVTGGEIQVHKVTVAADLGTMVNPNIVEQQIESSVIFGLSAALFGEITLKNGVVEQNNFNDYPIVRMNQSPAINITLVPSGGKPGGIGEPVTAMIGPAVANAVFASTGKRLRKLPLRMA